MRSKKTVLNIFSSLSLQIIVIISSLIVPKLIISSFGSDVNGLVTSITQFLAYITLLESGIGPVVKAALYKPLATKNKHEIVNILKSTEKFFKTIGKIFIVYLILLFMFYPILVNNEFNYLYTISLILIISISTFFEYFFGLTYQLFLDAKQESYVINFLRIGTYILNIIAVIILIKLNSNIHIVKLVSGMIFIIRPIITNLYVKKKNNINLEEADDNYKLEKKWDGLAQHIAAIIHGNTDITLLTLFSKLSEVSVYSVYYLIINGVKKITSSFTGGIDALFGDMLAKGENEKLSKTFNLYEIIYFSIITIFYICTLVLIVPFVSVYTKNISDVNYLRPTFAMILTLSEFVWSIRLPYSSITLAAGHFKETRIGAWVEVFTNIVISTILVIKHGIIGVVIGTLIAMIIRTIEFIYHSNKYILKRNIILTLKKIFIMLIEVLVITLICHNYINIEIINYQSWVLYGIIIFVICTMIIMIINYIVFNKESKELIAFIKKYIKKRRN
jgi:O-antigen/teichoic acid export membrane protein